MSPSWIDGRLGRWWELGRRRWTPGAVRCGVVRLRPRAVLIPRLAAYLKLYLLAYHRMINQASSPQLHIVSKA